VNFGDTDYFLANGDLREVLNSSLLLWYLRSKTTLTLRAVKGKDSSIYESTYRDRLAPATVEVNSPEALFMSSMKVVELRGGNRFPSWSSEPYMRLSFIRLLNS
jgi:hypothetical protein